jgi:hypothetical protein
MQTQIYSIFEYLYRDAGNYKAWGKLLLAGKLNTEQMNQMLKKFDSSEFFIAEQIGIPPLYEELWEYSNGANGDDHSWHSFHSMQLATHEEIEAYKVWGSVDTLLANILAVTHWKTYATYY